MKRALLSAVLISGFAAALAASAQAAPVDGALPVDGFAAMNARDAGATLDPLGDTGVDASSIARVWPGDAYGGVGSAWSGRTGHGAGFAPPADFEALLRDAAGRTLAADGGIDRNPYFALGTWGGDGRAIVHQVIDAGGPHASGYGAADYALELAFDGFHDAVGRRNDAVDPPQPFDGDPMFIPNDVSDLVSTSTPPTGDTPSNNGGSGGGSNGSSGGGDPGNGGNGGGNGDPGGTASGGPGGGIGGAPCPVPEPSGLALLLIAIPVVLLMKRRRALARVAVPAILAAAVLAFAPGSAKAQLRDWEQLCNGTGGATPDVIIEGCSAVIASSDESLNDVAIAYNNRGNALRELERFDEAKADYGNAIILAPSDPFPYRNRGVTYGLLGDYGRALADFNHAIVLAPKYASAYLGRAFAFEQLGNARAAAADFARAAKLDPKLVAQVRRPQAQTAALPAAR
jgi:Tetratricopeptide repeat